MATQRNTVLKTQRERERETHRQSERDRETETDRDREAERERERVSIQRTNMKGFQTDFHFPSMGRTLELVTKNTEHNT